jgi:putative peptidoglycan lipid II flippase
MTERKTDEPVIPAKPGLARTALTLLPLQTLFRGGEAILPLLLAAWFGRGADTDLYYLLAAYFVFAAALVTGAFQDSAVVPILVDVQANEPSELAAVAGSLLGHTLAVGLALAIVMGGLAAGVALFSSTLPVLALELVFVMSLGLVATAVRAFYVGLLHARGRFLAHPLASGTGMWLALMAIAAFRHALGVVVIPAALLMGELLAIVLLAAFCARSLGLRVIPHLGRPEPVRRIFGLVRLELTGSLITRMNPVIDQLMSRLAGVLGGGTLLLCANNVASLPNSILQATLLPAFLTRLAEEVPRPVQFLATTKRTLAVAVVLLIATAAALTAFRLPLCHLLFLHGAMDNAGVAKIADIVPWSLLGIAPFGALLLLSRAHVACRNSRIMPSMGVLNATCNVVFNTLFVGRFGLAGIALSTSVTYVVVAIVFWLRLPYRSHELRASG